MLTYQELLDGKGRLKPQCVVLTRGFSDGKNRYPPGTKGVVIGANGKMVELELLDNLSEEKRFPRKICVSFLEIEKL